MTVPEDLRCKSMRKAGYILWQCDLPAGHDGEHKHTTFYGAPMSWTDEQAHRGEPDGK